MTTIDDEYATARFAALSDAQLAAVVREQRDDYTERALELAAAELERRGVEPSRLVALQAEAPSAALARSHGRAVGERWLDVYAALLGMSAVAAPLMQLLLSTAPLWALVVQVPVSVFQLAVALGLRKRRAWGWYLNWLSLLVVFLAASINGAAVGALIWVLLNTVYFARRRRLFQWAKSTL